MDKLTSVFIMLIVFGGLFSGVHFMVSTLIYEYYVFTIIFLLTSIIFSGIFIGILGFDNFEPYDKVNWRIAIVLAFVITIMFVPLFWIKLFGDAERGLNAECAEKGLSNECTAEDMCGADCEVLGKEYYKYEPSSGLFSPGISDCWCKVNDKTEQIW